MTSKYKIRNTLKNFPFYSEKMFLPETLLFRKLPKIHVIINYQKNSDFNTLMYSEVNTKNAHKKHFWMSCLQNFKEILNNHRKHCLLINDTQAVKYESGIIKLKNYEKQIPIPFKIYGDTECFLKRINIDESEYKRLYQKHIPNSIGAKLACIDDRFTLPTKNFTDHNCVNKTIKWIFVEQEKINQMIKEHFNKKLTTTIDDEKKK